MPPVSKRNTGVCATCVRKCSLRSDRIRYCETYVARDGTGRPQVHSTETQSLNVSWTGFRQASLL